MNTLSHLLPMREGEALAGKLRRAGTKVVIGPHVRFEGLAGEQATLFFLVPCGNALECKAFNHLSRVFGGDAPRHIEPRRRATGGAPGPG